MNTGENGPNFQELLQTAQRVQEQIRQVHEDLARQRVEGMAGGGMVKVVANGRQQVVSVHIESEVAQPGEVEMLQDLVVAAVNQALQKSTELAQQEMAKVTGGMNLQIPGMMG